MGTPLGFRVGDAVFVRGVVYYYTGRVEYVGDGAVKLGEAAWIADSGRWHDALKTGQLYEVEPEPAGVTIPLHAICDWRHWPHPLPTEQK